VIRLIATLLTAVVVVWIGSRVIDEYDTDLWQTQKSALRERLVGAARSVADLAEEQRSEEVAEPALEPAPILPREEFSPPPERESSSQAPPSEASEPEASAESSEMSPVTPDDFDVEVVRRRLDRVMTLAAGMEQ
jgi:hypothetical protein